jgi:iron complex transport system substrate-binding protein
MQIRQVADMIGRNAAGEALVARIDAASKPAPLRRKFVLIYQGGGLILGQGTLADDLLIRAGFSNAARIYSSKPWDVQPLERIIMHPPDIILAPRAGQGEEARGLSALRRALNGRVKVADFDPALLYCGAHSIVRASTRLREIAAQ